MRTFRDDQGRDWDVVTGRESWGAIVALFIPRDRDPDAPDDRWSVIRQARLQSSGHERGSRELARCTEEDLQELLDQSVPKETG